MTPLAIIDLETTHLDPRIGEIIELGCVRVDQESFDIIETFDFKIEPTHIHTADPEALKVNGYTEAKWEEAIPLLTALNSVSVSCPNHIFTAYNVTFDWSFLKKAYQGLHRADPFHYHRYDVLTLAAFMLPGLKSKSLKSVCETLGIPPEPEIHGALNGALCAYKVLKALKERV